MLTIADASALVGTATPSMQVTKHIRVDRPFMYEGTRREVGEVFEVQGPFAAELVASRKASIVTKPALVVDTTPEVPVVDDDKPIPKRGKSNAR